MRVLIVEDEPYMAEAIRDGLRLEAIAADIAGDGDSALELLSVNAYDIAVLDRDIPGPNGDEIAKRIVASGSGMPILMLTAADRLDDKPPGSSSAPTTTSRSRSSFGSSCSVSERSTEGAPTTGMSSRLASESSCRSWRRAIEQGYDVESQGDTEAVIVTRGRQRRFRSQTVGKRQRIAIDEQGRVTTHGLERRA